MNIKQLHSGQANLTIQIDLCVNVWNFKYDLKLIEDQPVIDLFWIGDDKMLCVHVWKQTSSINCPKGKVLRRNVSKGFIFAVKHILTN